MALCGCATAYVVSSDGDTHTLRLDIDEVMIGTQSGFQQALATRASELCPAGWDKIRESGIPRDPPQPLMSAITAYEWEIRCW